MATNTNFDFTGFVPGPVPGTLAVGLVPIHWDPRCPQVRFTVNTAASPNPPGPDFISLGDLTDELQASLDAWNEIPTSYIEMEVGGSFSAPGNTFGAFDFINEVNFLPTAGGFSNVVVP